MEQFYTTPHNAEVALSPFSDLFLPRGENLPIGEVSRLVSVVRFLYRVNESGPFIFDLLHAESLTKKSRGYFYEEEPRIFGSIVFLSR